MKEQVAITIPIYKEIIDNAELNSLNQCLKVLHKYPIIFFCPLLFDISFYEKLCEGKINFKTERFDNEYFTGTEGYNKLMLNAGFYRRFNHYKFILIYQLDAYVFRDEVMFWCNQNYDYIAAPLINFEKQRVEIKDSKIKFLSRYSLIYKILNRLHLSDYKFRHIENGGLSLRKVSTFITLLYFLKSKALKWPMNEDTFYMYWFNIFFFIWKLPTELSALKFSFEKHPQECYELNNFQLPFGCHASEKHDPKFWNEFI